jgi:hypothetical protein
MPSVITHKLALALRFSDATDGRVIENGLQCLIDGKPRRPLPKWGGYFVFSAEELPEACFDLDVRASGYVPTKKRVLLEAPGIGPPLLRVEMIPKEERLPNVGFYTLSGKRKGLIAIDAVNPTENSCFAGAFDARKAALTVYNPYRLELNRARYALVDPNGLSYEPFVIEARISGETFKIDHPLVTTVSADFPIIPVVSGDVRADGEYLLRVRDEGADKRRLVRFEEDAGERFELIDFGEGEGAQAPARKPAADGKGQAN